MENDNRPYFAAAQYYIDNGKDLNKAVEWLDKAYAQNPEAVLGIISKSPCSKNAWQKNRCYCYFE
jgi:hypothetical protein